MKKLKLLCTTCWNVKWCSHYRKQYGGLLKKLEIECNMIQQPQFWVFIPKNSKHDLKQVCAHQCKLCVIYNGKKWKQPRCPLMVNGKRKHGIYIKCDLYTIKNTLKRRKSRHIYNMNGPWGHLH